MSRFRILFPLLVLILGPAVGTASAHVSLDSPNGGETFTAGEVVEIQWHIYIAHDLQNWDLWYATDAGAELSSCGDQPQFTWVPIAMDVPMTCSNAGGGCGVPGGCMMSYSWTVPDGIDSDQVKIRVRMDNGGIDYYDVSNSPFSVTSTVSVIDALPDRGLMLWPSYPNPMLRGTTIPWAVAEGLSRARLLIRDVSGRTVRILPAEDGTSGLRFSTWDGSDSQGRRLPAGTYFYTLSAGGRHMTRKLVLLQ